MPDIRSHPVPKHDPDFMILVSPCIWCGKEISRSLPDIHKSGSIAIADVVPESTRAKLLANTVRNATEQRRDGCHPSRAMIHGHAVVITIWIWPSLNCGGSDTIMSELHCSSRCEGASLWESSGPGCVDQGHGVFKGHAFPAAIIRSCGRQRIDLRPHLCVQDYDLDTQLALQPRSILLNSRPDLLVPVNNHDFCPTQSDTMDQRISCEMVVDHGWCASNTP